MVRRHALILTLLLAAPGCADIAVPRLMHPGSEEYQQTRAERFDPYPQTDVAPDIVGGRPLQYIKPAPLPERMQNELSYSERFRTSPPPGMYRTPRASAGRQPIIYSMPGPQPMQPPQGLTAPVVEFPGAATPPVSP